MTPTPILPAPVAATPPLPGGLRVLCLLLVVVAPAIAALLLGLDVVAMAARPQPGVGPLAALLASSLLNAGSVGYGIFAGVRLWQRQPRAVDVAKRALLMGLAVDVATTALAADAQHPFLAGLLPGALFFTLCFAYLQHVDMAAEPGALLR